MQKQILQDLGFSEGEEKTYMALLKLGSSSTGPISKETGISRSKIYEVLEKLIKKGVVSHYLKNNISYFMAAHPTRILDYLQNKEEDLKSKRISFEKNINFFEKIIGKKEATREAEVFEGMEGIKNVREIALKSMKSGEVMYYFGNPASSHDHVLAYWDEWNKRRVKKKIWGYIIYNQDAKTYGERRKKLAYTKVRYLPKKGNSHAWIEIYGDIVAIAIKYETPMSIVINNKNVAESFRTYFNNLWEFSLKRL